MTQILYLVKYTSNNNSRGKQMITIDANERFTPVEQCRMFNVDMSELMDPKDIRGNNKFLIRCKAHNDAAKKDPASVACKVDPKTHEIISGTPERIANLNRHMERIREEMAKLKS